MKPADTIGSVLNDTLPDHFPVTVVMERRPAQASAWIDHVWEAAGITVGDSEELKDRLAIDHIDGDIRLRFHPGLKVRLYIDECDSYYHNLMSPAPRCYIIVRQEDGDDEPVPFLVSMSFDEAHAYLEGDDAVFAVEVPAELYRWTESFVLAHYCPQQIKKRKRKNWKDDDTGRRSQ